MERLDKIIASQGQYTRSEIKKLATNGRITVNGTTISKADIKIDAENTQITVNGKVLLFKRHRYLLLNKPKGYTSIIEGNRTDTIMDLVPPALFRENLIPAGRLDRDASGLMIITDDGELAHNILSPRKCVRKVYEIILDVPVTEKMVKRFSDGIQISKEECKCAELEITGQTSCRVSTRDGRYFQIKKMFELCGAEVLDLHRICIGNLFLPSDMKSGECRELTSDEVELLQERQP